MTSLGITGILIADDAKIDRWSVSKEYLPPDPLQGPRVDVSVIRMSLAIEEAL